MLDQRFFLLLDTNQHEEGSIWETYKCLHPRSTMVLFSKKTKTPLAALTFQSATGCLSMLTARPAPEGATEPYFQGMVNKANEPFSFTISNLSTMDDGMIDFNILHQPHRVSIVNPGPSFGLNEINELHPGTSYTVSADQRTKRRMVLAGKTTKNPLTGRETRKVTVDDSEKDGAHDGLYFYLSVVAESTCKRLVDCFAEGTYWKVVPGFITRRDCPVRHQPSSRRQVHAVSRYAFGGDEEEADEEDDVMDFIRPVRRSRGRAPESAAAPVTRHCFALMASSVSPVSANYAVSSPTRRMHMHQQQQRLPGSVPDEGAATAVGSSQAGKLVYGDQIHVTSHQTGKEYAYEHPSEPTVLCLSIWYDMKVLPLMHDDEICALLDEEWQAWRENEESKDPQSMIESKIYNTDTRVIDLESEADTIICACGHQCINHAHVSSSDHKLRQCPMCRAPITAFIQVTAENVMVALTS